MNKIIIITVLNLSLASLAAASTGNKFDFTKMGITQLPESSVIKVLQDIVIAPGNEETVLVPERPLTPEEASFLTKYHLTHKGGYLAYDEREDWGDEIHDPVIDLESSKLLCRIWHDRDYSLGVTRLIPTGKRAYSHINFLKVNPTSVDWYNRHVLRIYADEGLEKYAGDSIQCVLEFYFTAVNENGEISERYYYSYSDQRTTSLFWRMADGSHFFSIGRMQELLQDYFEFEVNEYLEIF